MKKYLSRFSRVLALVVIVIILSVLSPGFLQINNLMNVLNQTSLNLIVACGMTITMLITGIDLSVGSILALTSVVAASYFKSGSVPEMAFGIGLALFLGFLLGAMNGIAVHYLRLPPFLVTFGTQQIIRGMAFLYMSGSVLNDFDSKFLFIGKGKLWGIPTPVIITVVLIVVVGFILKKTVVGREIYYVGSNLSAAKYSGISVAKVTVVSFGLSGMIAALAGIVYISRLNAAEAVIGESFALQAIAAAAIGGISFKGGSGSIYGTIIGALILTIILNGMNLLGVPTQWQSFATGGLIIIAVLMDAKAMKVKE
ncbi:MAG: ABC transporter permease [Negativicutes bacterium]